jgi:achilleol B synthase
LQQVYDGCQSWEIAFIVQAYFSTDLVNEFGPTLRNAHEFIKSSQVWCSLSRNLYIIKNIYFLTQFWHAFSYLKVLENHPDSETYYRHRSKGSWTLSTTDNGWSVSDCTAEALQVKTSYLWYSLNLLPTIHNKCQCFSTFVLKLY